MSTYNVLNAGSREVLNLDGSLTKEDAEQLASKIERGNMLPQATKSVH